MATQECEEGDGMEAAGHLTLQPEAAVAHAGYYHPNRIVQH